MSKRFVAMVCMAAAACGPSGNTNKDGSKGTDAGGNREGGGANALTACNTIFTAYFAQTLTCSGAPADEASFFATNTPCPLIAGSVAAGKVTFDGTKLAQCVSDIAGASCTALNSGLLPASCVAVFTGTVAAGATCHGGVSARQRTVDA